MCIRDRIRSLEVIPDCVKDAICCAVEKYSTYQKLRNQELKSESNDGYSVSVSYTHLDVYKRQIWYIRDIEGKRSIAEGLIYAKLATSIAARDNKYLMPKKEAQKLAKQGGFARINIGVDFGGNGSGHSFVAIGETVGFEKLIVLKSKRYLEGSIAVSYTHLHGNTWTSR